MNRVVLVIAVAVFFAVAVVVIWRWHAGSGLRSLDMSSSDAGSIQAGKLEDVQMVGALTGNWYSEDYRYAFRIDGLVGIATISNSSTYRVGEPMLRFQLTSPTTFRGAQIFTDGQWYAVTGELLGDDVMRMEGGGFVWNMTRP